MALENQINLYSVDTGNFYTKKERNLHNKNAKIRSERRYLINRIQELYDSLLKHGYTTDNISEDKLEKLEIIENTQDIVDEFIYLHKIKLFKNKAANRTKKKLLILLENKVKSKEKQKKGNIQSRTLDQDTITDKNVISLFESSLTRMLGVSKDELTEDILVIQVYYFDIFKDISFYGFTYRGEKYKYYTSSAGQIRKKKAVFVKESIWNKYEKTIMCGLTIDKINKNGGNNVNKHLAYMALMNSATDAWDDFDIDRTIVIDDFETNVFGEYDFIDDSNYEIKRIKDCIPITHTDGAGMVLFGKNRMFRAPWVKGLLGVFDYKSLILEWREKYQDETIGVIADIYGEKHDVIGENIYVIFTKSQFKMNKYYDSWGEYKEYFKKYNCKAGVCNIEEERIPDSRLNYQELQTLTAITDSELSDISKPSIDRLNALCSTIENMQRIFGVTPYNVNMTSLQKAVKIYPNIMNDTYFKNIIKGIKDSLIKKYKSAKLEVNGKYTFLLPDFYAACEFWFLHNENPNGLLDDKEVWCNLFKNKDKLDCLRSPHLYKEHAIRTNIASTGLDERKENISKWFNTNAIYTSCHDLISKMLQFDVDGDHALVIGDERIVDIAKRSMEGVVPLYYNMRKAEPTVLNTKNIYTGLNAAFTGSNIGQYSNNITKIWNSDVFIGGTDEDKKNAIDIVKLLCMENNFCIDYAKTLYKPERPKYIDKIIKGFTKKNVPYFFKYAKDKEIDQVEPINDSIVNKLDALIPNPRINTRKLGLGEIDYKLLMYDVNTEIDNNLIKIYTELNNTYHFKVSMKDEFQNNLHFLACQIREKLSGFGYDDVEITDMLVKHLYEKKNRNHKELLWFCYGKCIAENLKKNVQVKKTKIIQCIDCGEWLEVDVNDGMTCRCGACLGNYKKVRDRIRKQKYRMSHEVNG
jgi:hypothetical protein